MGYRDDFYIVGNIIGYTGTVHLNPTVYFQHNDEYGHITQAHDVKENIGREEVHQHPDYSIRNEMIDGSLRCVERRGTKIFHTSRNKFVGVAEMSQLQISVLNRSVINFTAQKPINSIFGEEWEDLVYGPEIEGLDVGRLVSRHERLISRASPNK